MTDDDLEELDPPGRCVCGLEKSPGEDRCPLCIAEGSFGYDPDVHRRSIPSAWDGHSYPAAGREAERRISNGARHSRPHGRPHPEALVKFVEWWFGVGSSYTPNEGQKGRQVPLPTGLDQMLGGIKEFAA